MHNHYNCQVVDLVSTLLTDLVLNLIDKITQPNCFGIFFTIFTDITHLQTFPRHLILMPKGLFSSVLLEFCTRVFHRVHPVEPELPALAAAPQLSWRNPYVLLMKQE